MEKLFEPGAVELADPQGDPNRVIEVQQKVEELLEANRQRREGIRQELLEQGAWALPGLMNATYVWMNELERSPADQDMLSSLMAELAGDNPAAADLLFHYGILETPFPIPRAIAREALGEADWNPTDDNLYDLRETLKRCKQIEDTQTILDLYGVLLQACREDDYRAALDLCKRWAKRSMEPAGDLLALLTESFPERAAEILTEVFLAIKSKYKDKSLANILIQPLRPIPPSWLGEGILLKISNDVLPESTPGRHTAVEYLWVEAARDSKDQNPEMWPELLKNVDHQVRQQSNEEIYRYWFEAAGKANEIEYVVREAQAEARDEEWGVRAALQLFFLQRYHQLARQALEDLRRDKPTRWESASHLFEIITGSPGKIKGETKGNGGPGGITSSGS